MLEGEHIPFKQQFDEPVKRHHYSLGYISTYITLILRSIPMRAIETVIKFFSPLIPNFSKAPTWYAGRLWILKLGYYKLFKPKEQAGDWIWIVDHLVQAGMLKCFVILGIRAKDLPKDRPLNKADVQPLALMPVKTSNGAVVCEQLQNAAETNGFPCAIVADHGSDLNSGVRQFCKMHAPTIDIYDITHCMASLLRAELQNDEIWKSFIELAALARKYMFQTNIAGLMPPNQRSKARYMNIDIMVKWGMKILNRLDAGDYPTNIDSHKLKCKLGWLPFFRKDLEIWNRILERTSYAEHHIRTYGYYIGVTMDIDRAFMQMDNCNKSIAFQKRILQAVFVEEAKLKSGQRLLGSTEIIESLFGSYNELVQNQSSSGFTNTLLTLSAMVSDTSDQEIKSGIEGTTIKQLKEWTLDWIGETVQAQRNAWLGKKKTARKCDENLTA